MKFKLGTQFYLSAFLSIVLNTCHHAFRFHDPSSLCLHHPERNWLHRHHHTLPDEKEKQSVRDDFLYPPPSGTPGFHGHFLYGMEDAVSVLLSWDHGFLRTHVLSPGLKRTYKKTEISWNFIDGLVFFELYHFTEHQSSLYDSRKNCRQDCLTELHQHFLRTCFPFKSVPNECHPFCIHDEKPVLEG